MLISRKIINLKMKKILTLVAAIAIAFQFVACDNTAQENAQKEEALKTEVMKIHDDAMAKMGEVGTEHDRLVAQLDAMKADSVMASDSNFAATATQYQTAISSLEEAKAVMMEWMNNFAAPADEVAHEEKMTYLEAEKVKVVEVNDKMDASIATAKELK